METISFRCSSCRQLLKIAADKSGRRVRCVKCGTVLTVPPSAGTPDGSGGAEGEPGEETPLRKPAAGGPGPRQLRRRAAREEDEEDDAHPQEPEEEEGRHSGRRRDADVQTGAEKVKRRRKRRQSRGGPWQTVRLGLLLLLLAEAVGAVGWIETPVLLFLPLRVQLQAGLGTLVITGVITMALVIAGYWLCTRGPEQVSRRLALVTLIVTVVSTLALFLVFLLELPSLQMFFQSPSEDFRNVDINELQSRLQGQLAALRWLMLVSFFLQLLAYAELVIVPVFLRSLAQAMKAKELEESCVNLLKVNAAVILFGVMTQLLLFGGLAHVLLLLGWVGTVLSLARTVWQVVVLVGLRRAMSARRLAA